MLGSEGNLLDPTPKSAHLIALDNPVLTNEQFAKLKHVNEEGFKSRRQRYLLYP